MSFDGFFLHHMIEELRSELVNGRIQKINQPFEQELVLQIRSNRQSHRLLLSAHPVFGRIQLTQTTFENPAQPSTFISLYWHKPTKSKYLNQHRYAMKCATLQRT